MLRRVVIANNIAKGVCGAIIVLIDTYVVIIENFISTRVLSRRVVIADNTNNYNRKDFNETTTIIRF